jgi:hypothetical protein
MLESRILKGIGAGLVALACSHEGAPPSTPTSSGPEPTANPSGTSSGASEEGSPTNDRALDPPVQAPPDPNAPSPSQTTP